MAQNYLFISISFYRNIVHQNVACEQGLNIRFISLQQKKIIIIFLYQIDKAKIS